MKLLTRLLEASPDLLAAKRAFGAHRSRLPSGLAHHAWQVQTRVSDLGPCFGSQLHAIGIGRKMVDGKLTSMPCVRLYVAHKLPSRLLSASDALPGNIDGIPTDVVEAAPPYFAAVSPCSLRRLREQRPAQGGISGANEAIQAGTLAARCRSRRATELAERFVLGNCHSFADFGAAAIGSAIVQPSSRDGGTADSRLAALHRFVPIAEGATATNQVDAAIAQLDAADAMDAGICTVGQILGTASASFEDRVHKHGRTTSHTGGVVDDPSVDVLIPLRRDDPSRLTSFVDQIRIRPLPGKLVFAQPGDSGALVLTKDSNLAVGLLFACPDNGSFAYANPIQSVLDALEIELD